MLKDNEEQYRPRSESEMLDICKTAIRQYCPERLSTERLAQIIVQERWRWRNSLPQIGEAISMVQLLQGLEQFQNSRSLSLMSLPVKGPKEIENLHRAIREASILASALLQDGWLICDLRKPVFSLYEREFLSAIRLLFDKLIAEQDEQSLQKLIEAIEAQVRYPHLEADLEALRALAARLKQED